ncbi:hypothetical protein V8C42DRAFT_303551 [Trichoderma barbatum]
MLYTAPSFPFSFLFLSFLSQEFYCLLAFPPLFLPFTLLFIGFLYIHNMRCYVVSLLLIVRIFLWMTQACFRLAQLPCFFSTIRFCLVKHARVFLQWI